MTTCPSCGAQNHTGATVCEYCDQALGARQLLVVQWSAQTGEGSHGEGRARVEAPAGADPERVQAACQAAFSASLDALGPNPDPNKLRADMRGRLAKLLPEDHRLQDLDLDSLDAFVPVARTVPTASSRPLAPQDRAPSPSPVPAQGRGTVRGALAGSLVLLALGGCCLLGGAAQMATSGQMEDLADAMRSAPLREPEDAKAEGGLVALEGVVAQVASPLVVRVGDGAGGEREVPLLYVAREVATTETVRSTRTDASGRRRTRTRERTRTDTEEQLAQPWQVGPLEVRPTVGPGTVYVGLEGFPELARARRRERCKGLRAGTKLTLCGRVDASGALAPDADLPLLVSGFSTRAETVIELRKRGRRGKIAGLAFLAFGAVVGVLGLVSFLRSKR
ncbi:MAG: zinc ribbon domain-containing protein [Planctomycetota bacterium]|nr:MAG: zinc ribbon domain-containing protein [Planctomycetota bacterium]